MNRATNTLQTRWAGDPERWGSTVVCPPLTVGPVESACEGGQVLRAQCRDLISIAWDFFARWSISGLQPGDVGTFSVEMTIGTGQSTSSAFWHVATVDDGAAIAVSSPRSLELGYSPANRAVTLPYTGIAFLNAPALAATYAPAVPADYRLHVTAWSVGGIHAIPEILLLREGIGALGGAGTWSPGIGALLPTVVDWWVAPGKTPFLGIDGAPGTPGDRIVSSISGTLVLASNSGISVSGDPVVACAINARPVLSLVGTAAPHPVTATITAHCAPRSWVP